MSGDYAGQNMEAICFANREYPCRSLFFVPENTTRTISAESLSNAILRNGSEYVSKEARFIDEEIFFFVPDEYISCGEKFLCDFISENIL